MEIFNPKDGTERSKNIFLQDLKANISRYLSVTGKQKIPFYSLLVACFFENWNFFWSFEPKYLTLFNSCKIAKEPIS